MSLQQPQTGKQKVADRLGGVLAEYGHHCHTREKLQRDLKAVELVIESLSGKIAGLREGLTILPDKEEKAPAPTVDKKPAPQLAPKLAATEPQVAPKALEPVVEAKPKGPVVVAPKRGRGRPKKHEVAKALKDLGEASAQVGKTLARVS